MRNDTYYKIGKINNKYVVIKTKIFMKREFNYNIYYSDEFKKCINFCKNSKYKMKGFCL